MRSRPSQQFSNAWGEIHLGPSSIEIGLIYPERVDLERDYAGLLAFHASQQNRCGHQLRIEKTKSGRPWLELSCWSRDQTSSQQSPRISIRLATYAGDRPTLEKHLQQSEHIEIGFVCLEEEEDYDKIVSRLRSGIVSHARGTRPILLRQMRIFGALCQASYHV